MEPMPVDTVTKRQTRFAMIACTFAIVVTIGLFVATYMWPHAFD